MIEESEPSEGQNQKIANIYFHPSLGGYLEFNYKKNVSKKTNSLKEKLFKRDQFILSLD